ncbi:MAG: carbohydrate binding domain-containing protein [Cyclobacteriaceae bacterium]
MRAPKKLGLLVAATLMIFACEEDLPTGDIESTPPEAAFTATPSSANPNYIVLDNTSTGEGIFSAWRYQEGREYQRDMTIETDTAYYPEPGSYEITLLVGNDAGQDSIKQTITIDQRDQDLPDPNADAFRLLADFESGEVGNWNAWGQNVTVVDNPEANAVNSSAKVLKAGQSGAFETAMRNETPIVTPATAVKVTVDAYFEVAGQLKMQIELPFETGYFIDVPAGEWTTIEYVFEDLGGLDISGDYPIVMFQGNADGNFYIDNIKYFDVSIQAGGGNLLGDFEDESVGPWNAWGQDVTIADNPSANAVNGTTKVLRVGQSAAFETAARNETPIIDPALATKVTVDAYFEVAGSLKLQIETPFETGYFMDVPAGEWVTIEYVFDADGVGPLNPSGDYPLMMFQGNTDGNFYLDNITYFE